MDSIRVMNHSNNPRLCIALGHNLFKKALSMISAHIDVLQVIAV
jgi:hypothetical protein